MAGENRGDGVGEVGEEEEVDGLVVVVGEMVDADVEVAGEG